MSKLYVFGIGGTGSRVLKSLTMLLASGVECGVDTIVPIIIDRDMSNSDLSRTKMLIEDYISVNKVAVHTAQNKFFKTNIELLGGELCLQLKDSTQKFDDFIRKRSMTRENQALVEMLFSEYTLGMDMTVGFQGNPNVGSVVLNQFEDSELFKAFSNDFSPDDKIFIISSIFGGTGASGFPLLHRVLQTPKSETSGLHNWGLINNASIGAITVLPYFSVESGKDKDSQVNADTFMDKAKAALSYYKTEDKRLETMYYIADKQVTTYKHNKGGDGQRNNAHFVELAAALAVLDFVNPNKISENINRDANKKIKETIYKEFGILRSKTEDNAQVVSFANLADETKQTLINPLTRFLLFHKYLKNFYDKQRGQQPYAHLYFDKNFINNETIKKMIKIQERFYGWLQEMEEQTRKFSPFILEDNSKIRFLRDRINVVEPRKSNFMYKDWALLDNELNRQSIKIDKDRGIIEETFKPEERFLELFYRASAELINYKN
ncbi:MAG: hypothetical protein LBV69_07325 [Bacteroidales bacterium]|jgi:hypothetical protein|nr:hypothetical protein [Bacteroidales bacterium]